MLVTILAALNQISGIPLGDKITTLLRRFERGDAVKKLRRTLILFKKYKYVANTNIMLIF